MRGESPCTSESAPAEGAALTGLGAGPRPRFSPQQHPPARRSGGAASRLSPPGLPTRPAPRPQSTQPGRRPRCSDLASASPLGPGRPWRGGRYPAPRRPARAAREGGGGAARGPARPGRLPPLRTRRRPPSPCLRPSAGLAGPWLTRTLEPDGET